MGTPFALDVGALFQVAEARGVDLELLADALPAAEAAIIGSLLGEPDE